MSNGSLDDFIYLPNKTKISVKIFKVFGIGAIAIALLYATSGTFSDFVDGSVILSTIAEGFVVSLTLAAELLFIAMIVLYPIVYPARYFILFGIGIIVLILLFIVCKKLPAAISALVAACKKLPVAISGFVAACKKKPVATVITSVIATALLFAIYNNDAEFTRITKVRLCGSQYNDNPWCDEEVLVKNIGINKPNDAKQSKVMIAYFDSAGLSKNYLSKMPEIKHYSMSFYRSTHATRRHFLEKKKVSTYNGNKTYLGYIHIGRCEDDSTKWKINISRNLGTADDYDKQGADTKNELLYNECKPYWYENPNWYEANKDNELVKYYMGLRGKRKNMGISLSPDSPD
jgi:hypothetical protein